MFMIKVVVCVCMVALAVEGAKDCEKVLTEMQPCRDYLKKGGPVPANCCTGVENLKSAASTPAIKRSFCECLKSQAKSLGVNSQYASTLPQKCKVDIGYPVSYNVNCTR